MDNRTRRTRKSLLKKREIIEHIIDLLIRNQDDYRIRMSTPDAYHHIIFSEDLSNQDKRSLLEEELGGFRKHFLNDFLKAISVHYDASSGGI